MKTPISTVLILIVIAIAAAACGTTPATEDEPSTPVAPSQPVSQPAEPSEAPSEAPSEEPASEERVVAGTITVAEGMAFSGPGGTIQEVLDLGPSGDLPQLANGVLFLDTDGKIYLASGVSDLETPTFDGPMLEVLNMDNEGNSWDMANAELLGLEEANGIIFLQGAQVLGYVEIP